MTSALRVNNVGSAIHNMDPYVIWGDSAYFLTSLFKKFLVYYVYN